MSYETEANAIRGRWANEWADATPTAYENRPFSPPDPPAPWVRLTIRNAESHQADLGPTPRYRHPGMIYVQVFTPHGSGDGEARALGDQAAGIFRGQSFGGVVCRSASVIPQGSDGTWYQVNVVCDFYRDTTY